jgi:hypothetical protein
MSSNTSINVVSNSDFLATRNRLSEIIRAPTDEWTIVDKHGDLYLLHYIDHDEAEQPSCGNIRGVLVDIKAGAVLTESSGYAGIVTGDSMRVDMYDGVRTVTTSSANVDTMTFGYEGLAIHRLFEGVVLRIIKHAGTVYYVSYRKILTEKSRWGDSPCFQELYHAAGGPPSEELFDVDKPYGSWCYNFLVVHPAFLGGSRQIVNEPYTVLLRIYDMVLSRYYPADECDLELRHPTVSYEIPEVVNTPYLHQPYPLSIDIANDVLKNGFFPPTTPAPSDPRLANGEAVIVTIVRDDVVVHTTQVWSSGYSWRMYLRDDNPNIYHQFFKLTNWLEPSYKGRYSVNKFEFLDVFILTRPYSAQQLIDLYNEGPTPGILTVNLPKVSPDVINDRENRLHLIWVNFVLSLPVHRQLEGIGLLARYMTDRRDLVKWLADLYTRQVQLTAEYHNRITGIFNRAKYQLTRAPRTSRKPTVTSVITRLVDAEQPEVVYSIIRSMRRIQNPPAPRPVSD